LATAEIFLLLLSRLDEEHGVKDLASARSFQFPDLKQPETSAALNTPLVSSL
jgi:hypothetical protein